MFTTHFCLTLGLTLVACVIFSSAYISISLDGDWKITNGLGNHNVSISGKVPGTVHTALQDADILENLLFGYNEHAYRWVAEDRWIYQKTFVLTTSILQERAIFLVFEGIDTFAEVFLDGHTLARTTSMFLRYRFDVTDILQGESVDSSHVIVVQFQSTTEMGRLLNSAYPYPLPSVDGSAQMPFRNFARKAQSDYGWDWGPAFSPQGLWKSVSLCGLSSATLSSFLLTQTIDFIPRFSIPVSADISATIAAQQQQPFGAVHVNVTVFLWVVSSPINIVHVRGELTVELAMQTIITSIDRIVDTAPLHPLGHELTVSVLLTVTADEYYLWWPVGYGPQTMYSLRVTYVDSNSNEQSTLEESIAFRQAMVVRDQLLDEPSGDVMSPFSESFYFEINGVPIFVKGANFIPPDVLHNRVNESHLEFLLDSALHANINLLRVWGGGIYQQSALYNWADRKGVMIWQEFMFACAMYPRNIEFLAAVRSEVRQAVQQISWHPSIVIWGGNNENEAALGWTNTTTKYRDLYLIDYYVLYVDTIRDELRILLQNNTEYAVSSPSNGALSTEPFVQRWGDPQNTHFGDVHYYNYVDDCTDISKLPTAKFVSEFGFQSHSSILSYAGVLKHSDLDSNSLALEFRQRHPNGTAEMGAQLSRHFQDPDTTTTFANFVYLTQAVQAVCYRAALSQWRRLKSQSPGHTMGIIYWQLNDIWPAPTWSTLEHSGRSKLSHYEVMHAYAALLVTAVVTNTLSGNIFSVFLTSDLIVPLTDVSLLVDIYSWKGELLHSITESTLSLNALDSRVIYTTPLANVLSPNYQSNEQFAVLTVLSSSISIRCATMSSPVNDLTIKESKFINKPDGLRMSSITVTSQPIDVSAHIIETKSIQDNGLCKLDTGPSHAFNTLSCSFPVSNIHSELRSQRLLCNNWFAFSSLAAVELSHANIQVVKVVSSSTNTIKLTLLSDQVAPWVFVESSVMGVFSGNALFLLPNVPTALEFVAREPVDVTKFSASLFVRTDDLFALVYWFRQTLAIVCGLIWGIFDFVGYPATIAFLILNVLLTYLYYSKIIGVDAEEIGQFELFTEGLMIATAQFLIVWICAYSVMQ